jgi:hypothetical protein
MKIVNSTKALQDQFHEDLEFWEDCRSSQIVNQEIMHFWDLSNEKLLKKKIYSVLLSFY